MSKNQKIRGELQAILSGVQKLQLLHAPLYSMISTDWSVQNMRAKMT